MTLGRSQYKNDFDLSNKSIQPQTTLKILGVILDDKLI